MPATVPAGRVGRATADAVLVAGLAVVAAAGPDGHTPPVLVALGAVVVVHVLGLVRNRVGVYPWVIAALAGLAVVGHGVGMGVDAAAQFRRRARARRRAGVLVERAGDPHGGRARRRHPALAGRGAPGAGVGGDHAGGRAAHQPRATSTGAVVEGLGIVAAVAVVAVGAALARHGTTHAGRAIDARLSHPRRPDGTAPAPGPARPEWYRRERVLVRAGGLHMTYRVIQWATGGGLVGRAALEGVLAHPDLEVAGCWVHSEAKDGIDVGELFGGDPIGVTATRDADALLATDADCGSCTARSWPTPPSCSASWPRARTW